MTYSSQNERSQEFLRSLKDEETNALANMEEAHRLPDPEPATMVAEALPPPVLTPNRHSKNRVIGITAAVLTVSAFFAFDIASNTNDPDFHDVIVLAPNTTPLTSGVLEPTTTIFIPTLETVPPRPTPTSVLPVTIAPSTTEQATTIPPDTTPTSIEAETSTTVIAEPIEVTTTAVEISPSSTPPPKFSYRNINCGDATPGQKTFVTIEKNMTLIGLAGHCKLTVKQLLALNPQVTDPNQIVVGYQLRVK